MLDNIKKYDIRIKNAYDNTKTKSIHQRSSRRYISTIKKYISCNESNDI